MAKVAVITGSNGKIGQATCKRLAQRTGAAVSVARYGDGGIACGDRAWREDEENGEERKEKDNSAETWQVHGIGPPLKYAFQFYVCLQVYKQG